MKISNLSTRSIASSSWLVGVHRNAMMRWIRKGEADKAAESARIMWHELRRQERLKSDLAAEVGAR